MPSSEGRVGLTTTLSCCCCFLIFLLAVPVLAGALPVDSGAVARQEPGGCSVCIQRAPNYVPHTSIQWSHGGKICVKKTFTRQDDWLEECEGSRATAVELSNVPSCEACHENSTLVEAWHKMWNQGDGSQCASVQFVPKQ